MDKYNEIMNKITNNKAKLSLENIKKAIDYFENEKVDYNIATIGRYCETNFKMPKTQSIRNNKDLIEYIEFRKNENNIKLPQTINNNKTIIDNILNRIEDDSIKIYIITEQEKYKLLEKKYYDLKKAIENIKPLNLDKIIEQNIEIDKVNDLIELKVDNEIIIENNSNSFNVNELLENINNKILKNYEIKLELVNDCVINSNTSSIIYEIK